MTRKIRNQKIKIKRKAQVTRSNKINKNKALKLMNRNLFNQNLKNLNKFMKKFKILKKKKSFK